MVGKKIWDWNQGTKWRYAWLWICLERDIFSVEKLNEKFRLLNHIKSMSIVRQQVQGVYIGFDEEYEFEWIDWLNESGEWIGFQLRNVKTDQFLRWTSTVHNWWSPSLIFNHWEGDLESASHFPYLCTYIMWCDGMNMWWPSLTSFFLSAFFFLSILFLSYFSFFFWMFFTCFVHLVIALVISFHAILSRSLLILWDQ